MTSATIPTLPKTLQKSLVSVSSGKSVKKKVSKGSGVYLSTFPGNLNLRERWFVEAVGFRQAYGPVGAIFRRGELHSVPSSLQGAGSMSSTASLDNSLSDMYRSPPRPLPYDAEPRYFRSRREKGSSHLNEESEPLRSDVDIDPESLSSGDKWNECAGEDGSKEYHSKSSLKLSSAKYTAGVGVVYASSEEEDVCPTCLEEYTKENPKIMTKCSHHFHLGCIYEWMERSDNCPVCGKVMVFEETLPLN